MKHLIIFIALISFFGKVSAQTDTSKVSANWFAKPLTSSKGIATQVGNKVAVCDTVYDYRVVSEALTLLNIEAAGIQIKT
jgi:hypothetical protein